MFLIKYNFFEYIIMFFRFCNALNTFQVFINDNLYEYFNIFYFTYLNDILIYKNIIKKYINYMIFFKRNYNKQTYT